MPDEQSNLIPIPNGYYRSKILINKLMDGFACDECGHKFGSDEEERVWTKIDPVTWILVCPGCGQHWTMHEVAQPN